MFIIELEWKEFSVDLDTIQKWLKNNAGPEFEGLAADDKLKIVFTSKPADAVVNAIKNRWNNLTAQSTEATRYMNATAYQTAVKNLKEQALALPYDSLTLAQRKLLFGMPVTRDDLGL